MIDRPTSSPKALAKTRLPALRILALLFCLSLMLRSSVVTSIGDDGVEAGPGESSAVYSVTALAGGFNRILIEKTLREPDGHVILRLVQPAMSGPLSIDTPPGWSPELAYLTRSATARSNLLAVPRDAIRADSGTGRVAWSAAAPGAYPNTLSIDVDLTFVDPDRTITVRLEVTEFPVTSDSTRSE